MNSTIFFVYGRESSTVVRTHLQQGFSKQNPHSGHKNSHHSHIMLALGIFYSCFFFFLLLTFFGFFSMTFANEASLQIPTTYHLTYFKPIFIKMIKVLCFSHIHTHTPILTHMYKWAVTERSIICHTDTGLINILSFSLILSCNHSYLFLSLLHKQWYTFV